MLKINKTHVERKSDKKNVLPKTSVQQKSDSIVFSFSNFKCVSIKNKSFNNCFTNLWEYGVWSLNFFSRISEYSKMSSVDAKKGGDSTRCHEVQKDDIQIVKEIMTELGMKNLFEQNIEDGIWQISLGTGSGRVFGYFASNIFSVLFFDPHHLVYADVKHGAKHDLLHRNYDPWENIS